MTEERMRELLAECAELASIAIAKSIRATINKDGGE